ncbi:phage terminase small subunit P27 family [Mesorhizobium sp. M0933]|uniref:phage terminase small subunit P27 family n=1 Tax=Mesorhizobium sp. M0933 TaxID=2957030 RepID=UPI00333B5178
MRGRKPELSVITNTKPLRAPRVPSSLGPVGRAEWRKVVPALAAAGILTEEMKSLVASYCEATEGAHDCARILKKAGYIVHQKGLPPKAHPAVRQHLQYQAMALRYAESLGITATARARNSPRNDAPTSVFD